MCGCGLGLLVCSSDYSAYTLLWLSIRNKFCKKNRVQVPTKIFIAAVNPVLSHWLPQIEYFLSF